MVVAEKENTDKAVIEKLEGVGKKALKEIESEKNPEVQIPLRTLSNVFYDEKERLIKIGNAVQKRSYLNLGQAKRFMQTMLIASACKDLIKTGKTTSIRDLFYMTKHTIGETQENTFDEQEESVCPDEPLLVRMEGKLQMITGDDVVKFAKKNYRTVKDGKKERIHSPEISVCAFDENGRIAEHKVKQIIIHPPNAVKQIRTASGRTVKVTKFHSLFTLKDGNVVSIRTDELQTGIWISVPRKISVSVNNKPVDILKQLLDNAPEGVLSNLSIKTDRSTIQKILDRAGKNLLKEFAKKHKIRWSDMTANWKHRQAIPCTLLKFAKIDVADLADKLLVIARGCRHAYRAIIPKDENLGAVLGYLLSEGSHSVFKKRDSRYVSFSNTSLELSQELADSFEKAFGDKCATQRLMKSRDGTYRINVGYDLLGYILEYCFEYGHIPAWEKGIPAILFDAPEPCVRAFLRTFRAGDGSAYFPKRRIRFHTSSPKLANGLMFLLARAGILSRLYTYDRKKLGHHDAYEVRVGTREYVKLLSEITRDFGGDTNIKGSSTTEGDKIPYTGGIIKKLRKSCKRRIQDSVYKKLPWYAIEGKQTGVSRETLQNILRTLKPYEPDKSLLLNLQQLVDSDLAWDRVVSIEDAKMPDYTLDFAVNPTQNFIGGNGLIILHNSDPIIEDLEVTIDTLREELHLFASNRGSMVGSITIVDSGDTIDCRKLGSGGWSIPSIVEKSIIQFKDSEAKFVLMVEKDAVWRRLNEDKFWKKHNCILIHGQGVPPRGVRRLLWRFENELKIPIYVFVDNDPWGLYIYSVIKQGSINLAYESKRMAIPSAKFIGLSSFDQEKYKLPKDVTIKLNEEDKKRANQILGYPWFQKPSWQRELKYMLEKGVKLELEALSKKGISFVTDVYLPEKIEKKEWLE